jgi:hypothetical protein
VRQIGRDRREAHFLAIPLLTAPAAALSVNDAGSGATAAFIVLHGGLQSLVGKLALIVNGTSFFARSKGFGDAAAMDTSSEACSKSPLLLR